MVTETWLSAYSLPAPGPISTLSAGWLSRKFFDCFWKSLQVYYPFQTCRSFKIEQKNEWIRNNKCLQSFLGQEKTQGWAYWSANDSVSILEAFMGILCLDLCAQGERAGQNERLRPLWFHKRMLCEKTPLFPDGPHSLHLIPWTVFHKHLFHPSLIIGVGLWSVMDPPPRVFTHLCYFNTFYLHFLVLYTHY